MKTSLNMRWVLILFISLFTAIRPVHADTVASGSSSASLPAGGSVLSHLNVTYSGLVHGPSIDNLSDSHTVDRLGLAKTGALNSGNSINLDGDLTAMYMVNKTQGAGIYLPFLLIPVQGQGLVRGDFGLKLTDTAVVDARGFNLSSSLYLQAPTSLASGAPTREVPYGVDMAFGLKLTPSLRYAVPHSRWTLGSLNELKWYAGVIRDKTFKIVKIPYAQYTLLPNLSAKQAYEMDERHLVGQTGYFAFNTYQTDLQAGVVWNVTSKVSFNPYLQIFTTPTVQAAPQGAERVAIGGYLSAPIL